MLYALRCLYDRICNDRVEIGVELIEVRASGPLTAQIVFAATLIAFLSADKTQQSIDSIPARDSFWIGCHTVVSARGHAQVVLRHGHAGLGQRVHRAVPLAQHMLLVSCGIA